ncbi:MAG: transporter [Acidimicrobiia bacterium]|nr:transporter [Acidimicrobiia bacterium]
MTPAETSGLRWGTAAGRWVVLATVMGSGMVSLDATVVNVALPRLGADLHADFAGLQWVVTGYTLSLASLILVGGSLGDRYGRRLVYAAGIAWFVVASLLCAVAPNLGVLIAARLLQGVGGALLTPGSLAILQESFAEQDRARAIGAWSGFGGVATAIGPLAGGWLVEAASWRWIFVLNVPLGLAVIAIVMRHVPDSGRAHTVAIDLPGAVLASAGLAAVTYGHIERSWLFGGVGIVGLAAFVVQERRASDPMLPLDLFRSRQFSATNAVTFVVYGALGMVLFLMALMLQIALGFSPIRAGSALLPITVVMLLFSARSGALAQRIGPRLPMTLGPMVVAVGLLLMMRIDPSATYLGAVLPAVTVFAAGLALMVAPLTATALAAAGEQRSGVASAVNNAVARVAGLIAIATLPLIAGFHPAGTVGAAALTDGFHRALLVSALLCVAGGALAWVFIRSDVLRETPAAPVEPAGTPCFHCAVDSTPLVADTRSAVPGSSGGP